MNDHQPVAWAVFDGPDKMHIAIGYGEAESCAEDTGGEIVPLYRSSRWIPVSERLPANEQRVLAWSQSNGLHIAYIDLWGQWRDADDNPGKKITHWMLLPEPPGVTP